MVKNPPCQQYKGPQIEYQRNGQTFCRNKIIYGTPEGKKIPPCSKYPGEHLIYVRNGHSYCRKTSLKNLNQSQQKTSKTNVLDKCLQLNHSKLRNYADLLNIDVRDQEDTDLCLKISKILNDDSRKILTTNVYYQTTPEDVKDISQLLNISLRDDQGKGKTMDQLMIDICHKVSDHSSSKMKSLLKDLLPGPQYCSVQTGYIITKIIKNILYPQKFPKKSPMLITEELNQKLISLKKRRTLSHTTEQELLRETLHSKLCHCIKGMLIKNKFRKDVLNKSSEYNPYAVCTQSVYKNRGFSVPKKTVRKCPTDYNWYRKLDYITGKKNKTKSTKTMKKSGGGNVSDNCTQSLEQVEMMKWPNIYANADGWKGSGWA